MEFIEATTINQPTRVIFALVRLASRVRIDACVCVHYFNSWFAHIGCVVGDVDLPLLVFLSNGIERRLRMKPNGSVGSSFFYYWLDG